MITEYKLYCVQCDLCEREYPGDLPDPVVYFPSHKKAEETIKLEGWIVMHNKPGNCPRILCPECNKEAERVMNQGYETKTTAGNKTHQYPQRG